MLCLALICGILPLDWDASQPTTGLAEDAAPVLEAASEAPTPPPTEEPTGTPEPMTDPTQTLEAEPTTVPTPAITPEVAPAQAVPAPADTAEAIPNHPYLLLEPYENGLAVIGLKRPETEIVIPASVEGTPLVSVSNAAMEGEEQLEKVTIEEGLLSIGREAFKGCTSLTRVELPASVTEIAADAFDGCPALTVLQAPEGCYAYDYAAAWLPEHVPASGVQSPAPPVVEEPAQSAQPGYATGDSAATTAEAPQTAEAGQAADVGQGDILLDAALLPDTDPEAALLINGNTVIGVGRSSAFTAAVQSSVYAANDTVLWSLGNTDAASLKISGNTATVTAKSASEEPVALTATLQKDNAITATVYLSILSLANKITVTTESGRTVLDINVPEDRIQLSAQVSPDVAGQTVVWKSSNAAVACVDANGLVSAGTKTGKAVITATAIDGSRKSGTCQITVSKALTGIAVTGPASVGIGKTARLALSFTPSDASNKSVIWSSNNPNVAVVSSSGTVKGIEGGEATITATSCENSALTAKWALTVAPAVTGMSITGGGMIDLSADAPYEKQLTLTVEPAATAVNVVWSSSKPDVATVDANGLVTATGVVGTAAIKASATDGSGKNATASVMVAYLPTGIQIAGSTTLVAGKSTVLRVSVSPTAASQAVSWASSDKAVATVDTKGVVKANTRAAAGTHFTVTATSIADKAITARFEMTIAAPVPDFAIRGSNTLDMLTDTSLTLSAETDESEPVAVLWSSGNRKVATVDASGTVTPLMAGTATITATAADGSGKKATFALEVISRVESIRSDNGPSVTLALGKTLKLDAAALPASALAADRVLRWESSDPGTVSVSAGTVKALKLTPEGEPVTITATAAGLSSSGETVSRSFSITILPMATKVTVTSKPDQNFINLNGGQATLQLSAAVLPATACQTVVWQSNNDAVATLDENGLVTGLATGKVTITATAQDASQKKATVSLTVFGGAESIAITGAESIRGGLSTAYTAAVLPQEAGQAVVWSIQADTVPVTVGSSIMEQPAASISATGVVKTLDVPETRRATITAKSKDDPSISTTVTLTILPMSTRVTINAARSMVSTNPASALQLTANVEPAEAAQAVIWRSSDTAIATVSENGVVTGKIRGNVIITATATDGSNACARKWIGVGESVRAIDIVGPGDMGTGTEADLTVVITPSEVAIPDVIWVSSNENIATVDAQGHVTVAESIEGSLETVDITATSVENPEVSDTLVISVRPAVTGITLTPGTTQHIDFSAGEGSLQLSAAVEPEGALASVTWASSDDTVATVDDAGLVTALCIGTTTIMATVQDQPEVSACVEVCVQVYAPTPDFVYSIVNHESGSTVRIDQYIGTSPIVNVPETILGFPVTEIAASAFYGCSSLTSATLPDGITSIGGSAFYNCSGLRSMTLPDGVTSIGSSAFQGCSGLASITMPNGLTSIENNMFRGCGRLTRITLPDRVSSIGNYAFYECNNLSSVSLSDGVTSIGDYAFYHCYNLVYITMPDTITYIGSYAFYDCSILRNITLPSGMVRIEAYSFYNCCGLGSIILPGGITSIGKWAFAYCRGLTSITLPDGLTNIETTAFAKCSGLISITIPEGITCIPNYAFHYCSSLKFVTLPESVTSIGMAAFYECSSLQSITLPDGITSIGTCAFVNCYGLTSITLPSGIARIEAYTFEYCRALSSITLPDGIASIEKYAFHGCRGLTSITLPDDVTSIGEAAFSECNLLTDIWIGEKATDFNYYAFSTDANSYLTIHGILGSYAETFAKQYGYKFSNTPVSSTATVVYGSIQTIAQEPLAQVTVTVYDFDTDMQCATTLTDNDGKWHISGLTRSKTYTINYAKIGYSITSNNTSICMDNALYELDTAFATPVQEGDTDNTLTILSPLSGSSIFLGDNLQITWRLSTSLEIFAVSMYICNQSGSTIYTNAHAEMLLQENGGYISLNNITPDLTVGTYTIYVELLNASNVSVASEQSKFSVEKSSNMVFVDSTIHSPIYPYWSNDSDLASPGYQLMDWTLAMDESNMDSFQFYDIVLGLSTLGISTIADFFLHTDEGNYSDILEQLYVDYYTNVSNQAYCNDSLLNDAYTGIKEAFSTMKTQWKSGSLIWEESLTPDIVEFIKQLFDSEVSTDACVQSLLDEYSFCNVVDILEIDRNNSKNKQIASIYNSSNAIRTVDGLKVAGETVMLYSEIRNYCIEQQLFLNALCNCTNDYIHTIDGMIDTVKLLANNGSDLTYTNLYHALLDFRDTARKITIESIQAVADSEAFKKYGWKMAENALDIYNVLEEFCKYGESKVPYISNLLKAIKEKQGSLTQIDEGTQSAYSSIVSGYNVLNIGVTIMDIVFESEYMQHYRRTSLETMMRIQNIKRACKLQMQDLVVAYCDTPTASLADQIVSSMNMLKSLKLMGDNVALEYLLTSTESYFKNKSSIYLHVPEEYQSMYEEFTMNLLLQQYTKAYDDNKVLPSLAECEQNDKFGILGLAAYALLQTYANNQNEKETCIDSWKLLYSRSIAKINSLFIPYFSLSSAPN